MVVVYRQLWLDRHLLACLFTVPAAVARPTMDTGNLVTKYVTVRIHPNVCPAVMTMNMTVDEKSQLNHRLVVF